jgi:hypothetical protein
MGNIFCQSKQTRIWYTPHSMRTHRRTQQRPPDPMSAASSRVPVLRALLATTEGMTGRHVARAAEINHQTCANTLARLSALGIVARQIAGRAQLFHLNRDSPLVHDLLVPLFNRDQHFMQQFLQVRTPRNR